MLARDRLDDGVVGLFAEQATHHCPEPLPQAIEDFVEGRNRDHCEEDGGDPPARSTTGSRFQVVGDRGKRLASNPFSYAPANMRGKDLPFRLLWIPLICIACRPTRPARLTHEEEPDGRLVAVAPVVRKPTVVAFWLAASDTLAKGEGRDLREDFKGYTARVAPVLHQDDIELVGTTVDSIIVELTNGPNRIIRLGGLDFPFGYVLVEPGYAETILTGVYTDDDLLEQVVWYFGLDEDGTDSMPGQVVIVLPPGPVRSTFTTHLERHRSLEGSHFDHRAPVAGAKGPFTLAGSPSHGRRWNQVVHQAAAVAHQVKRRSQADR